MLPLQLSLKPSRYLTYLVILYWLAQLGLLASAAVSLGVLLTFALGSALLGWRWLRKYAWLTSPYSLRSIKVNATGWHLRMHDGSCATATPAMGCRFIPGLIVLRLRQQQGDIFWWILLADSADSIGLRRLRMVGRWGPKYQTQNEALEAL